VKIAAVVPAYNEAGRIGPVLAALAATPVLDEVIVVDDGSADATYQAVEEHPAVRASGSRFRCLRHPQNRGKGAAMRLGADAAVGADVLVFLDADLIGLTPAHVQALVAPVASGQVDMVLGVFRGGRGATTLAQVLAPNISGQRAIRRDVFLRVPCLASSGYGVELAITNFVIGEGYRMTRVILPDVTHQMKEEKLGLLRGLIARLRMYWQMLPYLLRRFRRKARRPQ
jgi:Glycosyltransferases involved in cell wall biogenesis